jgi:hypothetical protein
VKCCSVFRNNSDKVYWSKVILAVLVALICIFIPLTDLYGLLFGVAVYFGSIVIYRYVLDLWPKKIPSLKRIYMIGVGAYFLTWIALWGTLYTILYF